jgi:hypothetical protein
MNHFSYIKNLLGGYFHQDWAEYGPTYDDVLNQYFDDEWEIESMSNSLEELRLLLHLPDEELTKRVISMGCDFYPIGQGLSYRNWLQHVEERLSQHIADKENSNTKIGTSHVTAFPK